MDLIGTSTSGPHKGTAGYYEWLKQFGPGALEDFKSWIKQRGITELPNTMSPEFHSLMKEYTKEIRAKEEQSAKEEERVPITGVTRGEREQRTQQEKWISEQKEINDWIQKSFPDSPHWQNYSKSVAYSLSMRTQNGKDILDLLKKLTKPPASSSFERWTINKANAIKEFVKNNPKNEKEKMDGGSVSPSFWIVANARKKNNFAWAAQAVSDLAGPSIYLATAKQAFKYKINIKTAIQDASLIAIKIIKDFPPTASQINDPDWLPKRLSAAVARTFLKQHWETDGRLSRVPYHSLLIETLVKKVTNELREEGRRVSLENIYEKIKKVRPEMTQKKLEALIYQLKESKPFYPVSRGEEKESEEYYENKKRRKQEIDWSDEESIDEQMVALEEEKENPMLQLSYEEAQAVDNKFYLEERRLDKMTGVVFPDSATMRAYEEIKTIGQSIIDEWIGNFARKHLSAGVRALFIMMVRPDPEHISKGSRSGEVYREWQPKRYKELIDQGVPEKEAKYQSQRFADKKAKESIGVFKRQQNIVSYLEKLAEPKYRERLLEEYEKEGAEHDIIWEFINNPSKFYVKTSRGEGRTVTPVVRRKLIENLQKDVLNKLKEQVAYDKGVSQVVNSVPVEGKNAEQFMNELRSVISSKIINTKKETEEKKISEAEKTAEERERLKAEELKKKGKVKYLDLEKEESPAERVYNFIEEAVEKIVKSIV